MHVLSPESEGAGATTLTRGLGVFTAGGLVCVWVACSMMN